MSRMHRAHEQRAMRWCDVQIGSCGGKITIRQVGNVSLPFAITSILWNRRVSCVSNYLANNRNCSRGYKGGPVGVYVRNVRLIVHTRRWCERQCSLHPIPEQVNFQRRFFVTERLSNRRVARYAPEYTRIFRIPRQSYLLLAAKFQMFRSREKKYTYFKTPNALFLHAGYIPTYRHMSHRKHLI